VIHSMANIPPSYYHASTAILIANHGDFFNTHAMLRQPSRETPNSAELQPFAQLTN
jgi:hypothetical protein